jgi:putative transcriptional regulator
MKKDPKRDSLINRRKQLNMSQRQVAKELGISQGYYALIEKGKRDPGFDLAISISDLFNLDVRSLKT